jgi:myo-inositol-1(or 4)-monophosphatase
MTADVTDRELRDLAERLAREAGAIALEGRRTAGDRLLGDTKSTSTDLVTEFDRAAEQHIVGELRRLRPDDAVVGEEGTDDAGTSGLAWYLDPIDGTTNFVYDQVAWACSIGVSRDGEMVAGAVYVPPLDELFAATRGHGATRNGATIRPSAETDLALALVGTGFSYHVGSRVEQAEVVAELIGHVRDIRRLGSAAFDLCMVACGRLDVYYERYLNPWDSAAGELIAREAGATASDFAGSPSRPDELVVATPGLHTAFLAALDRAIQGAISRSPGDS